MSQDTPQSNSTQDKMVLAYNINQCKEQKRNTHIHIWSIDSQWKCQDSSTGKEQSGYVYGGKKISALTSQNTQKSTQNRRDLKL